MSDLALEYVVIGVIFAYGYGLGAAGLAAALLYPVRLELPRWTAWIQGFSTPYQLARHRWAVALQHGFIGAGSVSVSVALVFYALPGQTTPVEQRMGGIIGIVLGGLWALVVVGHAVEARRNPGPPLSEIPAAPPRRRGIDLDRLSKRDSRLVIVVGLVGLPIAMAIGFGVPPLVAIAVTLVPVALGLLIAAGPRRR